MILTAIGILITAVGVVVSLNNDWSSQNRREAELLSKALVVIGVGCVVVAVIASCSTSFFSSGGDSDQGGVDVPGLSAGAGAGTGTGSDTGTGTGSDTGSDTGTGTGSDTGSDTGTGLGLSNPLILSNEEPAEGYFESIATDEDYFANSYYNVMGFNVSGWTDDDKHDAVMFVNPGVYTNFSGTFYSPKKDGGGANTIRFVISCDGVEKFDSGDIAKDTRPVDFKIDISGYTNIEINCYYIKGSTSLLAGSGSADGRLANAMFFFEEEQTKAA